MPLPRKQFETLALEQIDALYRAARVLTRDVVRAQDLVQETYLRALAARDSFELREQLRDSGMKAWLLRILHNLGIRSQQRELRQPHSDHPLDDFSAPPAPAALGVDWDDMDQELKQAIQRLPGEYQLVLLLWAVEELNYKEIADVLDIPLGTVMSRLHRARQRLREELPATLAQAAMLMRR